jgi:hypothetical protein
MMTEPNRSLDEVPALVAERKKFESWISALEARRETTPAHVFERVRADYASRLREVDDRLAAHRSTILDEKTNLESRRSLLEAEEQMRRDERAELELRAHVGELVGAESEAAFSTVDDALAKMGLEKDDLSKRIAELDGLLNLPGDAAAAPAASSAEMTPGTQATVDINAAAAEQLAQSKSPTPSKAAEPAVSAPAAGAPAAVPEAPTAPAAAANADPNKLVLSEHSATFIRSSGQMPDIDEVLAEPVSERSVPPQRQPTKGARLTPGGGFDELAFLNDVVGLKGDGAAAAAPSAPAPVPAAQPAAPPPSPLREEPPKSPLEGVVPSARPSNLTPPLASNVGNTPITLRASGAISQSKTLKCTECGAMNYPTEWYCERCGAELAAL